MAESKVDFGKEERDLVLGSMLHMLTSDLPIGAKQMCAMLFAVVALRRLEDDLARVSFGEAFREVFG